VPCSYSSDIDPAAIRIAVKFKKRGPTNSIAKTQRYG